MLVITGIGLVSGAGAGPDLLLDAWAEGRSLAERYADLGGYPAARVPESLVRGSRKFDDRLLLHADAVTVLAAAAARAALSGHGDADARDAWATVFGSSRGATGVLETETARFLARGTVGAATSPRTTAGTLAATVAQMAGAGGPAFSVSSACATGLTAVGTLCGLIKAGMADGGIAGGAEAAATPLTMAQLTALSVVAPVDEEDPWPAKPFHPARRGLLLGEGAAALVIERDGRAPALARILGFGAATEAATATGISASGEGLVRAVRMALQASDCAVSEIDMVVAHGAGTVKGDAAEHAALRRIFGDAMPPVSHHKWLTGHTLGAAGAVSAALATHWLSQGLVPPPPPVWDREGLLPWREPARLRRVLVVGLGFGGQAAALLLGAG